MAVFSDQENNEIPEIDPEKDYLSELVGDGKKFSDPAALARAKAESDRHIKLLEAERAKDRAEMQRIKDEAASLQTLQSVLDHLNADENKNTRASRPNNQQVEEDRRPNQPDAGEIKRLIQEALDEQSRSSTAKANQSEVARVLSEKFGPGWQRVAAERAQALGVSLTDLDQLAEKAPKLVFQALNIESKSPNAAPSQRVSQGLPASSSKKNYKYFEKIRKEQGNDVYWSPAIQAQVHAAASELGDAFFED